jgi:hypothetical protein
MKKLRDFELSRELAEQHAAMTGPYKPITNTAWVRALLCKLQKGCTRLASDKVYQLLAHGRWFSPASSTNKTGRHDIAEILLKVALEHQKTHIGSCQVRYFNCPISSKPAQFCILKSKMAAPVEKHSFNNFSNLLAHGRWFSPASSTNKTGRHDMFFFGVLTPR